MTSDRVHWIFLTPSYPPDQGGIADYTWVLARELASRGDLVDIWTGPRPVNTQPLAAPGVSVFHLPAHFTPSSCRILEREIARIPGEKRILVQYVPQPLGPRPGTRFKGFPLWFCYWLRRQHTVPVWLMLHEAETACYEGMHWKLRLIHRLSQSMLSWSLASASRVFYAMPAWERVLRRHQSVAPAEYLPIPSNIETDVSPAEARRVRNRLLDSSSRYVLGHFGTYSREVTELLKPVLQEVLQTQPHVQVLLIGQGSCEFAIQLRSYSRRVIATGALESREVAAHLAACDLMLQPFPDGASTRRGSVMAALALGVPVLSNLGSNSEGIWLESGALALAGIESMPQRIASLLDDPEQRETIGVAGKILYGQRFSVQRTLEQLRHHPSNATGRPSNVPIAPRGPQCAP